MKKILCTLLAMLMLAMCGCGGAAQEAVPTTTEAPKAAFSVGYAKANITPEDSVPMGGYNKPSERMSTGYNDYLYATVCAITDESGETAILIGIDLTSSYSRVSHDIREAIEKEHGIPFENILYSASHMHTGPDLNSDKMTVIAKYKKQLQEWVVDAVGAALEDRKPATMYIGSTQTEGLNFVRRYLMNDGTYAGDNFGDYGSGYKAHETEADGQLQLIKFVREGGKDVVLANWQGHPHRANSGGGTVITSDIVGVMRAAMEEETDCLFAYFTGASGNINNGSRIPGETITADYVEHGKKLAEYAQEAAKDYVLRENGPVQIFAQDFEATAKHSSKTTPLPITAFSLGDVAFVTAPYEMFNRNGKAIKSLSPFATTFISCYTNGGFSYIPDEITYNEYNSYEETQCKFAMGTAEELELEYILMLKTLFKTAK